MTPVSFSTATNLSGEIALVTGASRGIGQAIAEILGGQGATVVGTATSEAGAAAITERLLAAGIKGRGAVLNVADVESVDAVLKDMEAKEGNPSILINNAGSQHVAPVDEFPEDKWDAILAIILSSAFHTTKAALPGMKAKGWGRVINTGSMHSLVASPYKSAYNAAKHGLAGLTKTIALEVATQGITVNCICPGYVWTSLVENQIPDTMKARGLTRDQVINDVLLANQPQKQFVQVEQLAALAVFLCRDGASAMTGTNLSVDGGWTAQ